MCSNEFTIQTVLRSVDLFDHVSVSSVSICDEDISFSSSFFSRASINIYFCIYSIYKSSFSHETRLSVDLFRHTYCDASSYAPPTNIHSTTKKKNMLNTRKLFDHLFFCVWRITRFESLLLYLPLITYFRGWLSNIEVAFNKANIAIRIGL